MQMGLIRLVTHLRITLNLPGAVGLRLKEDFVCALSPGVPVRCMNEPKMPPVYWPLGYFFLLCSLRPAISKAWQRRAHIATHPIV